MSQHLRDGETEWLLRDALQARTANVQGRPESLLELRLAHRAGRSRRLSWLLRLRRLPSAIGIITAAVVVLLIVVGVNWARDSYRPAVPTRPSHSGAPLKNTGFGYSPADYFPAVRSDGQPVIVRASDGQLMRILPRGEVSANRWAAISPMVLSPDGNRVYGVGRQLQDNGQPYPAGTGADHVVYIDLRTNQFFSLATRDGRMNGFALSADGTTFAYSLRGGQDGMSDRDVIYVHDLVHDTDRHFALAAGQRVTNMALSPNGSDLAVTLDNNPSSVQLMSTTSGQQPPQQSLATAPASCPGSRYGSLQWTRSGLYAVRSCTHAAQGVPASIVRVDADPTKPAAAVAGASTATTPFYVYETHGLIRSADTTLDSVSIVTVTSDGPATLHVSGIRLSGPGT